MTPSLHHVVLTVTDIETSVPWYKDLFDLVELADEPHTEGGGQTVLLGKPDWSMAVGLAAHPSNAGETFSPTRTGLDHVGFTVPDRATLEQFEARLSDIGIKHSSISDHEWGSSLNFRDPDDLQLQLIAFAAN